MRDCAFWLIGDWRSGEWAEVRAWLRGRGQCREIESVATAVTLKKPARLPAALVVAQPRPGLVANEALESLAAVYPNSTKLLVNGPWCEGEHRPVLAVDGVVRVPWRRWRAGLSEALGNHETERSHRTAQRPVRGTVWSNSRSSYSHLADALGQLLVEAVWLGGSGRHTAVAEVIVYDGWEHVMPIPVARRARRKADAPVRIVLRHFPRPDDALAAAAWGIDAMLPQPFLLSDLANTLDRLLVRG